MRESKNISEAIAFYKERIRLLAIVVEQGFDTLEEHNIYKKAEEQIKKHKKKVAKTETPPLNEEKVAEQEDPPLNDEKVAEREDPFTANKNCCECK